MAENLQETPLVEQIRIVHTSVKPSGSGWAMVTTGGSPFAAATAVACRFIPPCCLLSSSAISCVTGNISDDATPMLLAAQRNWSPLLATLQEKNQFCKVLVRLHSFPWSSSNKKVGDVTMENRHPIFVVSTWCKAEAYWIGRKNVYLISLNVARIVSFK